MTERPARSPGAERTARHRARKKAEAERLAFEATGGLYLTVRAHSTSVERTALMGNLTGAAATDQAMLGETLTNWYNNLTLITWKKKHPS